MRRALILFVSLVAGCAPDVPTNEIRASGHVEATEVRLAPEVGGRIVLLPVNEGDRLEKDGLVLRLGGRESELVV